MKCSSGPTAAQHRNLDAVRERLHNANGSPLRVCPPGRVSGPLPVVAANTNKELASRHNAERRQDESLLCTKEDSQVVVPERLGVCGQRDLTGILECGGAIMGCKKRYDGGVRRREGTNWRSRRRDLEVRWLRLRMVMCFVSGGGWCVASISSPDATTPLPQVIVAIIATLAHSKSLSMTRFYCRRGFRSPLRSSASIGIAVVTSRCQPVLDH